jgi:KamA family protein
MGVRYISKLEDLKNYITIDSDEENILKRVIGIHPFKITDYYLSLINPLDKNDPIKKMIIPSADELNVSGAYDTSGEKENTKLTGLQHKYDETALVLSTNRCDAYCRFCFRKRLVGLSGAEILNNFDKAIKYIKEHKEISNVLISGGDSFSLPTKILAKFLEKLEKIKHLRFIRFGTRIPIVNPERISKDKKLLKLLKKYSKPTKRIHIITHFNHPREITKMSIIAIDSLLSVGVILQNQTVLMRGVNDNPEVLRELMNRLTSIGVNPYYVFQCRPVSRVKHHFQVPIVEGYKIIEDAKKKLNGIAKRFKYAMSHKSGKIEILAVDKQYVYFKQHQAKNEKDKSKIIKKKIKKNAAWLDDFR